MLWAAFGLGALLGASASFRLAGSSRLAAAFGIGLALWGIPLILGAGSSAVALTAVLLAAVGVGNALVDVTVFTLLQRLVPDHVLGRVLGTAEMIWTVTVALASIATPFFIEVSNLRITLVVAGGALPLLALLCWRALARVDAVAQVHAADVAVLQAVPMLRPLPVPAIEHLAAVARDSRVPRRRVRLLRGGPRGTVLHHRRGRGRGHGRGSRRTTAGGG